MHKNEEDSGVIGRYEKERPDEVCEVCVGWARVSGRATYNASSAQTNPLVIRDRFH